MKKAKARKVAPRTSKGRGTKPIRARKAVVRGKQAGAPKSSKYLVIYDSFFGNTEQIAQAIGGGLGSKAGVLRVDNVKADYWKGVDTLVVGSPTRAFRPSPKTKKLLGSIPRDGLQGVKVAAFDTRMAPSDVNSPILNVFVRIFGWAAKPIANGLTKKGGKLVASPEGFFVKGSEGPLKDGELKRASSWAKQIAAK
jgi:flavodoxin I